MALMKHVGLIVLLAAAAAAAEIEVDAGEGGAAGDEAEEAAVAKFTPDSPELRDVFYGGHPWLIYCMRNTTAARAEAAVSNSTYNTVFLAAGTAMGAKRLQLGELDCTKKLPSGKSTMKRFKLVKPLGKGNPVLLLCANGAPPRQIGQLDYMEFDPHGPAKAKAKRAAAAKKKKAKAAKAKKKKAAAKKAAAKKAKAKKAKAKKTKKGKKAKEDEDDEDEDDEDEEEEDEEEDEDEEEEKPKVEKVECAKLRIKQLRKVLKERGTECNGCSEKGDFVKLCEKTQADPADGQKAGGKGGDAEAGSKEKLKVLEDDEPKKAPVVYPYVNSSKAVGVLAALTEVRWPRASTQADAEELCFGRRACAVVVHSGANLSTPDERVLSRVARRFRNVSFVTVSTDTHHFSLLKKLPALDKDARKVARARKTAASEARHAKSGKKGGKKGGKKAETEAAGQLYLPRVVAFKPWRPDNVSKLIVRHVRSGDTVSADAPTDVDYFEAAAAKAKKGGKGGKKGNKKLPAGVDCPKLPLKKLRALLKGRAATCEGCAEKQDFVDLCESTQQPYDKAAAAAKGGKAAKSDKKAAKSAKKKAKAKKDEDEDDEDDEDGDDDDDDDDEGDDLLGIEKEPIVAGKLSLCAKQLRDEKKNLTAVAADRVFDENAVTLKEVLNNVAVVDHKNLLVELFGRRYPFEVGERFAFAKALYGVDWGPAEAEKLMERVVARELKARKKSMRKGLHAKAHTGDFGSGDLSEFLEAFYGGKLGNMASLAKGAASVRPRLDVTTPQTEKEKKERKRKAAEAEKKRKDALHWKKRQDKKRKKKAKPETEKERALREAKIRQKMDEAAADLIQDVDEDAEAGADAAEDAAADGKDKAKETAAPAAEPAAEAATEEDDEEEIPDEAKDDEEDEDEVLELD